MLRRDERVLRVRDAGEYRLGVEVALRAGGPKELLDERRLVSVVEDGKRSADGAPLAPEDVQAERVERSDGDGARGGLAVRSDELRDTLAHLTRRLVGERERDDRRCGNPALEQPHDAMGDDPRLARARSG